MRFSDFADGGIPDREDYIVGYRAGGGRGSDRRWLRRRFGRETLEAERTYYVDGATGSNSNDGLSPASAFLTPQYAADIALTHLDFSYNNVVLQIADGTYGHTHVNTLNLGGAGGQLIFRGNLSTAGAVIFDGEDDYSLIADYGSSVAVQGIHFVNSGGGSGLSCIGAFDYATIFVQDGCSFGEAGGHEHIQAGSNGLVFVLSDYTVNGSAKYHFDSVDSGTIAIADGLTVTVTGNPAFTTFVLVDAGSILLISDSCVFSGAATGRRYEIIGGGMLYNLSGVGGFGNAPSPTFFPGSVGGDVEPDGEYIPVSRHAYDMVLVNGANNDVAMVGGSIYCRISGPTGAFAISGFVAPKKMDFIQLTIQNPIAQNMTITNQAGSAAGNQIITNTGADVVITGIGVVHFIYSVTDNAWILTGTQG